MPELTSAVRSHLSQTARALYDPNMNIFSFDEYTLDLSQHLLSRGDETVELTPRALDVLRLLVENAGKVVSREKILEEVWAGQFVEESNITVQISALRSALGDDGETEFIRTVHGKGYCFTAPVTVSQIPANVLLGDSRLRSASDKSVSVLPLKNESDDPELEYVAEALTDSLTNSITRVKGLRVVPRDAASRHSDFNGKLRQIAAELRVSHLLIGRIRSMGSDIIANFELIDVENDDQLWGEQMRLDGSNLLDLQKEATERISDLVLSELGLSRSPFTFTSTTRSPESHRLYLKGKYLFDQRTAEQIRKAIASFETAIIKDPSNIIAYTSIVEAYRLMYGFDLITFDEVSRASAPYIATTVQLDSGSDLVLHMLGGVKMYFDWDFEGAEKVLERAIAINPTNLEARYRYADVLLANKKFAEALHEFNRLLEIDPASPHTLKRIGKAFYRMSQFNNALHYVGEVLELEGGDFEALAVSGAIRIEMGDFKAARIDLDQSLKAEYNVDVDSMLGYLLASEGNKKATLAWIGSFLEKFGNRYPLKLARIYGALGDRVKAFELISEAIQAHEIDLICLQSDPRWNHISDDPHFHEALRRVGFK